MATDDVKRFEEGRLWCARVARNARACPSNCSFPPALSIFSPIPPFCPSSCTPTDLPQAHIRTHTLNFHHHHHHHQKSYGEVNVNGEVPIAEVEEGGVGAWTVAVAGERSVRSRVAVDAVGANAQGALAEARGAEAALAGDGGGAGLVALRLGAATWGAVSRLRKVRAPANVREHTQAHRERDRADRGRKRQHDGVGEAHHHRPGATKVVCDCVCVFVCENG